MVDERISRAIDNDHTAAMKITSDGRKLVRKKNGSTFTASSSLFVCTFCKKLFKNHLIYRKHLKIHSEKSYMCHECNKSFVHKHYLLSHMLSHTKSQLYQCHLCHKRFTQKGNLNQHLKFHTSKKPFKCNECKRDFFQQEHLKAHMRQHTNERPYQCEVCNKSFNIKSSLQRHMNCHTGAKPFICDICNRGYTRRSVLVLHIQQVHENKKPYQCGECQMCFSQKGNLQAHFRRKHMLQKSENKRGMKDREKIKHGIRKQSFKHSSKLQKNHAPKNVTNLTEIYKRKTRVNKPVPEPDFTFNGDASKIVSGIIDSIKVEPNELDFHITDHELISEMCISSLTTGKAIGHTVQPNVSSLENGELNRFLNNSDINDALCDSDSDNLPTFQNPYAFASENLPEMHESRVLAEFETLLGDAKDLEDYLMSDDELLEPQINMDILCSPYKVSNGVNKPVPDLVKEEPFTNFAMPCHDYATPPQLHFDDIPASCSKVSILYKSPEKENALKTVHSIKNPLMHTDKVKGQPLNLSMYNQHKVHLMNGATVLA